ncbi:MAG: type VI secretion system contractile sheath small subunit [Pirellula sp.]|jgi:type VI secretion system protein ImpB|nr:type VI secretion system contractile sheath small subunit [Pirellula sp.]
MAKQSAQKFIARNRAPRVQIEYDVEVYGAQKSIQLPFVMGVLSDLSGNPSEKLPAVGDRKFLEIDVDNFDERLKSMKPRVAFAVPNTLTGEGNLMCDITFESMDDFSPAAIAKKVEPLRKLLETRTQLANLLTYMDGKSGAEELIGKLINDPSTLRSLASTPNPNAKPSTPAPVAPVPPAAPAVAAPAPVAPAAPPAAPTPPAGTASDDDLDALLNDL